MLFNNKNKKKERKQRGVVFLIICFFSIILFGASGVARAKQPRIHLLHLNFDPLITDPGTTMRPRLLSNQSDTDQTAGLYIVQFNHSPLPADQQVLKNLGVKIYSPLADHALIVRMNAITRKSVENMSAVRWVGSFHAAYKLEGGLSKLSDSLVSIQASQPTRFSIMLFESGSAIQQIVSDRIRQLGGQINLLTKHRRMEATFNPIDLDAIAQMPEVLFIERWTPAEDDMDMVRNVSGATFLETAEGYTGQGVRGEVMDDGILGSHQDFQNNPPLFHDTNNADNNHGTLTYGIIFGSGASKQQATGLLPDAEQPIFSSRYDLSNRYAHTQELVDPNGIYRAVFQSNSWGNSRTTDYTTISAEMDQIIFDHDIVITQSQSNAGNQDSRPQAWAKNIVAVGGIRGFNTATRSDDRWGNGASIGPASDGRIKPDISQFYDGVNTTTESGNTAHRDFGGTSAATPIAAGYFGLMFQMWSDGVFSGGPGLGRDVFNSRPHAATAKALIINSAFQYSFSGRNHDKTRVHQGWGFPDVKNLYQEAKANGWKLPILIDETKVLDPAQIHQYSLVINAAANTPLKATMVYSDPPGLPNSTVQRINDLTLKVTSPSGVVYWGNNGLLDGNWSTSGGTSNSIDTVENVFVQTPELGTWTIEIQGDEIVQDSHVETAKIDADYALVVTGGIASTSVNLPPVSDAGPDQTVDEGATVTLDGNGSSDPDGSVVAYKWIQLSGPAVIINNRRSATASFTAPGVNADTVIRIRLRVTDDKGTIDRNALNITVKDTTGGTNLLPVSDAGPDQTVNEGAAVTLDGSGSIDPDGSIVAYKWIQLSGPAVVINNRRSVTASFIAPGVTANTVIRIRLRVTDDSGVIDRNALNITINNTTP